MGISESTSKRRLGVIVNYGFLLLTLILSLAGRLFGWSVGTVVCFWLSVAMVIVTFYPVHVRTGLWRLAHAKADRLDEREIQQTLESLRYAYAGFSIATLLVILAVVILDLGDQTLQLAVFWVLLYLAHTLPSSVLAWTMRHTPSSVEEY
jgi:hypothetical protein